MNIIKAKKEDLVEILELQKKCYKQEAEIYNDFSIQPLKQTLNSISVDFEKEEFYKIEIDSKIVGSVRYNIIDSTCKIGKLIVLKEFQNKGIGTSLMRFVELQNKNVLRFELFTGQKSLKNLALYKKLGYLEFKRKRINDNLELVFLEKKIEKNN